MHIFNRRNSNRANTKAKIKTKIAILAGIIALSLLATIVACSMEIDERPSSGGAASSAIKSANGLMVRSAVDKMIFMGGSVLYSPKDANANQLAKGVVVAVQLNEVSVTNLGNGNYAYKNSVENYSLGYITIDSISLESVSFTYHKFESDKEDARPAGNFTIALGGTADLNGDGKADIAYTKPAAGRKGIKNNRWLTFICDVETHSAAMFSVVPMQYARSVYPNGLLGINPNGQYIVQKYDIGTANRAAISAISYGDYVFDSEANSISIYVGEERSGRSARALEDSELEVVKEISEDATPEDFEFKPNEFTEDFDIYDLLGAMPKSIVTEDYTPRTVSENVAYLNRLIRNGDFLPAILAENPGDVESEIRTQLAQAPISGELEQVLFNRHSLALFYPEKCPDVNLAATTLSVIMPWMRVKVGDLPDTDEIEEMIENQQRTWNAQSVPGTDDNSGGIFFPDTGRTDDDDDDDFDDDDFDDDEDFDPTHSAEITRRGKMARSLSTWQNSEIGSIYLSQLVKPADREQILQRLENLIKESDRGTAFFATLKEEQDKARNAVAKLRAQKAMNEVAQAQKSKYETFCAEREKAEQKFSELKSIDVLGFVAGLVPLQFIKDIVEGTNSQGRIGVGGHVSFANAQPSIGVKFGVYACFELKDQLSVSIKTMSIFTNKLDPDGKMSPEETCAAFQKEFPGKDYSEAMVMDYAKMMNDKNVKEEYNLNRWYFNWKQAGRGAQNRIFHPSSDAKQKHGVVQLAPPIPIVLTYDFRFDFLITVQVVTEFKGVAVAGYSMQFFEASAGINWGFREYFWGFIPKVWTAYFEPYAKAGSTHMNGFFAGCYGDKLTVHGHEYEWTAGGGVRAIFVPVFETRVGIGIGVGATGGSADMSLGVTATLFTPASLYLGFSWTNNLYPIFITEVEADAGLTVGADLQFSLEIPIVGSRHWNWDIPKLKFLLSAQLFRFRMENLDVKRLEGPKPPEFTWL